MPTSTPAELFVDRFAAGWRQPHPHAWDDLLDPDVVLRQPLLPTRRGRPGLAQEYARLLQLLPDLTGRVTRWVATGGDADAIIDIHVELSATLGGRPLHLELVDVCVLRDGLLAERTSYLDPTPAVVALLRAPRAWSTWWRSGVGPFTTRRQLLKARPLSDAAAVLAAGRLLLGIPAWLAPTSAACAYGFTRPDEHTVRYLMAVYGARASALGVGTLLAPLATRRRWQTLGLAVDIADTLAALRTPLPARTRVVSLAITGGYALIGAHGLRSTAGSAAQPGNEPSPA
jgi:ketosteroid isomerase-like protein